MLRGTYTSLVAFVAHLSSSCAWPKALDTCQKQKKNKTQAHTCRLVFFSRTTLVSLLPSSSFNQKQPAPTSEMLESLPSRDASPANSLESCRPSTASRTNQPANQPAKKPCPRRADWPRGVATTTMTSGQHHALGGLSYVSLVMPSPGGSPPACPSLILSFCLPSSSLSVRPSPSLSLLCCNLQAQAEKKPGVPSGGLTHHTQPTAGARNPTLAMCMHATTQPIHAAARPASQMDRRAASTHQSERKNSKEQECGHESAVFSPLPPRGGIKTLE